MGSIDFQVQGLFVSASSIDNFIHELSAIGLLLTGTDHPFDLEDTMKIYF